MTLQPHRIEGDSAGVGTTKAHEAPIPESQETPGPFPRDDTTLMFECEGMARGSVK